MKELSAVELNKLAVAAGNEAAKKAVPTPMVVIGGEQRWFVAGGVCGFAWATLKANTPANRKFLSGLKKAGIAGEGVTADWSKDSYYGGYSYWVRVGGQSMETKEAFCHAFVKVLQDNGITAHSMSRMD